MHKQKIAQLYRQIAQEFEPTQPPVHNPEPVQPTPQPPSDGKVTITIVYQDARNIDVWINENIIPSSRGFDRVTTGGDNRKYGWKTVQIDTLNRVRLNPNDIKKSGLNNEGFGFFSMKIVDRAPEYDMNKLDAVHKINPPNPNFYGESYSLGYIWNRSGDTIKDLEAQDPTFFNKYFTPQWSGTGKIVLALFNYGINHPRPVV